MAVVRLNHRQLVHYLVIGIYQEDRVVVLFIYITHQQDTQR